MTFLPVGSATPDDPIARLILRIPGETDLDSIEQVALSEGFYGNARAARRAISHAIASGSLITRKKFLERLGSTPSRRVTGSVRTLGILSNGRWSVVAKSAARIISGANFLEQGIPLTICDDSGAAPSSEVQLLGGCSPQPIQLRLIGREERERYLQTLLASPELHDVDPSAFSFGLLGSAEWTCRAGANRNWWLLEGAGDKSVLIDDDAGPDYLTHGSGQQAVRASSNFHPLRFRLYPEPHLAAATDSPSFVQVHNDIIGRSSSDLLVGAANGSEVDLSSCRGELAHSLLELDPAVAVCATGLAGHPGWGSRRLLWYLHGSDRKSVVEDRRAYRLVSASPSVDWSANKLTISHSPFFHAPCIGFDGTRVLPPFPPVGRNQDSLIGLVIHRCFAPGSIAHMPIGIVHHRPPAEEHDPFTFTLTTNDYLSVMLQDHELPHRIDSEPMRHLESLGSHLAECASVPAAHFADYVAELSREQADAEYCALTALLDQYHGRPRWWAGEIRKRQAMIDRHVRENTIDVSDVSGPDRSTRVGHLQRAVGLYGELLQMWPVIYRVACELRDSGRQPSRPLLSEDSA